MSMPEIPYRRTTVHHTTSQDINSYCVYNQIMLFSKSSKYSPQGHQQIRQDGVDDEDRLLVGVEFAVQYMGSIEVASFFGTGSGNTDMPVAQVMAQSKTKTDDKKKRMTMSVTYKSLTVKEDVSGKLVASFPISKVTYCNVDATYEKAFVFVARERTEKPFKAYIFLCDSKSKAQEVFQTLSLAFKMNYESFQATAIREANLRAYARSDHDHFSGFQTDLITAREPNEKRFTNQNGFRDRQLTNGSSVEEVNMCSPTTKDFMVIDKRVELLQNCRNRSNTDPIGHHLMSASGDEDFDEFTQLAKSRSKTVHQPNHHTGHI